MSDQNKQMIFPILIVASLVLALPAARCLNQQAAANLVKSAANVPPKPIDAALQLPEGWQPATEKPDGDWQRVGLVDTPAVDLARISQMFPHRWKGPNGEEVSPEALMRQSLPQLERTETKSGPSERPGYESYRVTYSSPASSMLITHVVERPLDEKADVSSPGGSTYFDYVCSTGPNSEQHEMPSDLATIATLNSHYLPGSEKLCVFPLDEKKALLLQMVEGPPKTVNDGQALLRFGVLDVAQGTIDWVLWKDLPFAGSAQEPLKYSMLSETRCFQLQEGYGYLLAVSAEGVVKKSKTTESGYYTAWARFKLD